jgi:hypothetical protein
VRSVSSLRLLGQRQAILSLIPWPIGRFTADLAKTLIEALILAAPPVPLRGKRRLVLADRIGELQEAPLCEPAIDHRITSSGRMHVDVSKFVGDRPTERHWVGRSRRPAAESWGNFSRTCGQLVKAGGRLAQFANFARPGALIQVRGFPEVR